MSFAKATDLEQVDENRWRGELAEGWDVVGKTNGGYTQAIATRASSLAAEGRDPVSITGHFARPGQTGPIEVETEVVRSGRRFSIVRSRVKQNDAVILETLGTFQSPATADDGVLLSDIEPSPIPPPESCLRVMPAAEAPFPPPLMAQLDIRLDPESAAALTDKPSGKALIDGWFRLKDGEPFDPFTLVLAADAFPPTTFAAALPVGWTPTLELTVHVRAPRPTGWLRCEFKSHFVTGGFIEEDGLLWDEHNRLVAQSRQLALVAEPKAPATS